MSSMTTKLLCHNPSVCLFMYPLSNENCNKSLLLSLLRDYDVKDIMMWHLNYDLLIFGREICGIKYFSSRSGPKLVPDRLLDQDSGSKYRLAYDL